MEEHLVRDLTVGVAIRQLVNVQKRVWLISIDFYDFFDPLLELNNWVYLEVVVQEEHLLRFTDVVDN